MSGHMVDTPGREPPRFPPGEVPRVTNEVRAALARWNVGPGTTLVTGGARGADILAAEEARSRGAGLHLVLAYEPDKFVSDSVELPGTDWERRFRALLRHAEVEVEVVGGPDDTVYERTNERILQVAREIDERPYAVIVWNGEAGDGPGGTEDLVSRLGLDERVIVIDPTPRQPPR